MIGGGSSPNLLCSIHEDMLTCCVRLVSIQSIGKLLYRDLAQHLRILGSLLIVKALHRDIFFKRVEALMIARRLVGRYEAG